MVHPHLPVADREVGENARSEELRPPVSAGITCVALKISGLHL
jgi:hypothetical protein